MTNPTHTGTTFTVVAHDLSAVSAPMGMRMVSGRDPALVGETIESLIGKLDHSTEGAQLRKIGDPGYESVGRIQELARRAPPTESLTRQSANLARYGIKPLIQNSDGSVVLAVCADTPQVPGVIQDDATLGMLLQDNLMRPLLPRLGLASEQVTLLVMLSSDLARIQSATPVAQKRELQPVERAIGLPPGIEPTKYFLRMVAFAAKAGASDIHIDPYVAKGDGAEYTMRIRRNGVLEEVGTIAPEMAKKVLASMKSRANLKIDEQLRGQDGRISFNEQEAQLDGALKGLSARVSTTPALLGHNAVLRLLRTASENEFNLDRIGFTPEFLSRVYEVLSEPNGIFLVTGPTGSGKTTTLYSILSRLNDGTRKIVTVEDPVEVGLPGITQTQVNSAAGVGFPEALRTFLRQDPNVILIGEIRDSQTAAIAVEAASTGHLVFATLHTRNSIGALPRLRGQGVEDSTLGDSLKGVLSQRLARTLCGACKESYDASEELNRMVGEKVCSQPVKLFREGEHSRSCGCCNGTGYTGRIVLPELWVLGQKEREMILAGDNNYEAYAKAARDGGMRELTEVALDAIKAGQTSIDACLGKIFSIADLRQHKDQVRAVFGKASL